MMLLLPPHRPISARTSFLAGVLTTLVICAAGWGISRLLADRCNRTYHLLSPMARCISLRPPYTRAYEEFETDLGSWIEEQRAKGVIDDAAVYFRDMQNGPWFGLRESDKFLPASLFKLPVMMAILKAAEAKPSLLTEHLVTPLVLPQMPANTADPARTLLPNTEYSVDELLYRMIAYSDNLSMDMLVRRLDSFDGGNAMARKIYSDLGVLSAESAQTISVKSYASLFRILYNARYLSQDSSAKALSFLAASDFKDALVAGVPEGIVVAHKYGVHNLTGNRLLHDCGIVYHPVRPYLLCVMTRGDDIDTSVAFIAELSRRVYAQVEQNIVTW